MKFILLYGLLVSVCSFNINFAAKKISLDITKAISATLAGADHTGQNVLEANKKMIHKILESEILSYEIKKDLALFCIKLAQFGDQTGHNILLYFHHFVEKCL